VLPHGRFPESRYSFRILGSMVNGNVLSIKKIALSGRTPEIGQSTDAMRVPLLKGNSIGISNVLFSCERRISVQAIAKYSLSVHFCFKLHISPVKCFFAVYNRRVQIAFLFKKN